MSARDIAEKDARAARYADLRQSGLPRDVAYRYADTGERFGYAVTACFHDPLTPGTPVLAWPGSREGSPLVTCTRSEVWSLGDGSRVVAVDGFPGGIALTHIDVLPSVIPPEAGKP